ncbi:hypothetical protein GCM10009836_21180 [Pseudonocardia ailaonensis]|uniref:Histidine kinase n=1 Tax=Pseudonocardia ailaonensis TaxID=367279 RepID=A0ABN2MY48_9PSEU
MTVATGLLETDLSARLLRGVRVAQCVIVLVILLGLNLPNVLAGAAAYRPEWIGLAGWAVMVALALVDGLLVARHRFWGRARWPVAIGVLALAVAMALDLRPAELSGPAHITLGVAGWFWVLLFADGRLRDLVALIVVHLLVVLGLLLAAGRTDQVTLVSFATTAVAVSSFQLAVGMAGSALRAVARGATESALAEARARTAEEIATAVHSDREARYAALRSVALPLLSGIGAGTSPPSDPEVQRAAAAAAARLRRMFDEEGDAADALAAELGGLVDIAERRGVVVRYSERGPRQVPPPGAVREMLAAAGGALHASRVAARVTLTGVGEDVVLGVVTDGTPAEERLTEVRGSRVEGDGVTWVEVRWTP